MSERYSRRADGLEDMHGLDELSDLYRQTRSDINPPLALDNRIRKAARAALAPHPRASARWTVPLALAATVVLAVGLVNLMPLRGPFNSDRAPAVLQEPATLKSAEPVSGSGPAPGSAKPLPRDARTLQFKPESGAAPKASPAPAAPVRQEESRQASPSRFTTVLESESEPREPRQWLEQIIRLRRQGRDTEAAAQLRELQRHYPDFAIPLEAKAKD